MAGLRAVSSVNSGVNMGAAVACIGAAAGEGGMAPFGGCISACWGGFALDCRGCGWSPWFLTLASILNGGAVPLAGWAIVFASSDAAGNGCTMRSACMAWPGVDRTRAPASGAGGRFYKGVVLALSCPVVMPAARDTSCRRLAPVSNELTGAEE